MLAFYSCNKFFDLLLQYTGSTLFSVLLALLCGTIIVYSFLRLESGSYSIWYTVCCLLKNFFLVVAYRRQVSFGSVVTQRPDFSRRLFLDFVLSAHKLVEFQLLTGLCVISISYRKVFLVVYTWCTS